MDTRRLILLSIFIFSSFMLWENWQKYNQPKPAPGTPAAVAASVAPQPTAALQPGAAPMPATAGQAAAPAGEMVTISTDLVKATFSTVGGDLTELELKRYKAHEDKTKTFVLFDAKHQYLAQSGLIGEGLPNHRTVFKRVAGPSELDDNVRRNSRSASRR